MSEQPHHSPLDEAFEASLRTGLTVAGQAAEQLARAREQRSRDELSGLDGARRALEREDAERAAARAQLTAVHRDEWWTNATPAQIAQAWQDAAQWRDGDPTIQAAAEHIRNEVRHRYGIDVEHRDERPGAAAGGLERALSGESQRRQEVAQEATSQRDDRAAQEAEAAALLASAERASRDQDRRGELVPDSHAFRVEQASRLLAAGRHSEEEVTAKLVADAGRQHLPGQVDAAAVKGPRARRASGRAGRRDVSAEQSR